MVRDIYTHLKGKGLNPYFPGQHKGNCKDEFVIIMEGTQMPSIRSNQLGQQIIDFIIFVPAESYIKIDPYKKEIRQALKEISNLRKTGQETPTITDDDKKAYTTSIEYVIQKKLEG